MSENAIIGRTSRSAPWRPRHTQRRPAGTWPGVKILKSLTLQPAPRHTNTTPHFARAINQTHLIDDVTRRSCAFIDNPCIVRKYERAELHNRREVLSGLTFQSLIVPFKQSFKRTLSYSVNQRGETKTPDHEISIDPGPKNTFWAFFQNVIYVTIFALQVAIFD